MAVTVVLAVYAGWRSFRPLRFVRGSTAHLVELTAEMGLALVAVVSTGYWGSPFAFCLVTPVVAAGFALGFGFALRLAAASGAAVAIPYHLRADEALARVSVQWGTELILVALVAGYARRLFFEAEERTTQALSQMRRLSEANELLFELNRVAQALPASLDFGETVASTVHRVRELFAPEVIAILLRDDTSGSWPVAVADGVRLPKSLSDDAVPPPLARAARSTAAHMVEDLSSVGGPGLGYRSRSGMYAPLHARGVLIGLLAVEHGSGQFDARALGLLDGVAQQAALALDNARWFGRLRTVGADEERTRIARDLHDRVGSSLAYLGFELDRIGRLPAPEDVQDQISSLRQDVRRVLSEVREMLYDLRTDVSDTQDLVATLDDFLGRVGERSSATIAFHHEASRRLPLPQEREIWRIAQEAITNAERHGQASQITVRWLCNEGSVLLEVADNGVGFDPVSANRMDAYGMLGMRERADAIGASIEVTTAGGKGTTVRCWLGGR